MQLMHTDIQYRFGRLHENGSTEREKAGLTALPFFFPHIVFTQLLTRCLIAAFHHKKNEAQKMHDWIVQSSPRAAVI